VSGVPPGAVLATGEPWYLKRIVTPLGIRFRDIALDAPITHGLVTMVKSRWSGAPPSRVGTNADGVFGFHSLPGLHDFEYPRGLDPVIASPPDARPFVVMVADLVGRFLPAVFGIELPLVGPASPPTFDLDPDPAPVLDAYLFTAPTRAVTCEFAAIRADLWDLDRGAPAAHARVRVTVGDRSRLGVADERGRLLVLVPSPLLDRLRLGSPPGLGQVPPSSQTFPVAIDVWHRPDLPRPFPSPETLPEPWSVLPGLKGILEHPDRAFIWPTTVGPPVLTWTGTWTHGRELIVRTTTQSELWISRGASPP
jgi:hypothetical protein